jgi:hypothetical protein
VILQDDDKEEAMRPFLWYLWLAGAVQLVILLANIPLPKKLRCRENLARVSPMIRAVFIVHWAYIVLVLGIFIALCFGFASDLAGGSRLGRFLSTVMAIFWLARVPVQLFFYDSETRRRHRAADVGFLACFSYLGMVFAAAALGAFR